MTNDIKINVTGPPKSGKTKVVEIIKDATKGLNVVVTEKNDKKQKSNNA